MDDPRLEMPLAEVARQLQCCTKQLKSAINRQLRPLQLTESEYLVLWLCHEAKGEPIVQGHTVAVIGLSPAQLSGLTDRLGKRGILNVDRCDTDRRRQLLSLTPTGHEIFQQAQQLLGPLNQQLCVELSQEEVAQFLDLAGRLLAKGASGTKSGKTTIEPTLRRPNSGAAA